MTKILRPTFFLLIPFTLIACAPAEPEVPVGVPCEAGGFSVVDDFDGARRGNCRVTGKNQVTLEIVREDDAVTNPSPWFAFKLIPGNAAAAEVVLDYGTWEHRYMPKISDDGVHWRTLDARFVLISGGDRRARLRVPLGDGPIWVAAQELLTPAIYDAWSQDVVASSSAKLSVAGLSTAGHPIYKLDTGSAAQDVVLFVGRQHPPEVSGSFALFSFVETLLADTELALSFRKRFRIIAIPLLNPDGVVGGNWRHGLGGVDLNRDWGPFTQPETLLVKQLLDELDEEGARPRAFLDFHSTDRNLFYTQPDEDVTDPVLFTRKWFARVTPRLTGYAFTNEIRPTSDRAISKNYVYKRYGIPALTYEVGDETDRVATANAARVFAEEFMRLLLDETG